MVGITYITVGYWAFYYTMLVNFYCVIAGLIVAIVFKGKKNLIELILGGVILLFTIITVIFRILPYQDPKIYNPRSLKIGFFFMLIFTLGIIGYNAYELFLKGNVTFTSETIKCPSCGAIIKSTETFCSQCGAKLK